MKTFRMIGMALVAVLMCVNFVACGDDEKDENTYYAYGILFEERLGEIYPYETEFEINEVEQLVKYKNEYNSTSHALVTEFHPFTEEQYIYLINHHDPYSKKEEITKDNLIEKLPELPYYYNFLWQCLGEYKYIAYLPTDNNIGISNVFVYNKIN